MLKWRGKKDQDKNIKDNIEDNRENKHLFLTSKQGKTSSSKDIF